MTTESEERKKLVGFCEQCQDWYYFTEGVDSRNCPVCGHHPSVRTGFQITTQRTFNPKAKKLTKAQLKRLGNG